jgi:hypothetical protein
VAIGYLAYPDSARIGGNVNGVNTYAGVDLGDLTGGVFSLSSLLTPNGNNLACFFGAATQAAIPDFASLPLNLIQPIRTLLNRFLTPFTGGLSCPQISTFSVSLFDRYPGYKYSPTGPATNFKA